jgi:hypothetical protein
VQPSIGGGLEAVTAAHSSGSFILDNAAVSLIKIPFLKNLTLIIEHNQAPNSHASGCSYSNADTLLKRAAIVFFPGLC